jgi:hypothetical protein
VGETLRQLWLSKSVVVFQANFRFFSATFLRWYSASRLSISLFGTEISCFASFSKREYSSDGLLFLLFFAIARYPFVFRQSLEGVGQNVVRFVVTKYRLAMNVFEQSLIGHFLQNTFA